MNLNTNTITIKQILAKVMLVVILLTSVLGLSGCGIGYGIGYQYYRSRETDGIHSYPCTIRVKSITNTFDPKNVNLVLEIGIHETSLFGVMDDYPQAHHAYGLAHNLESLDFAIYLCDGKFKNDFPVNSSDNISLIDNHLFYREIKEEEAFTKEYGYNKFTFNHQETIKIPSEYFYNDEGSVAIKLVSWVLLDGSDSYFTSDILCIILEYERVDDKIIITNFYERSRYSL